MSSFDNILAYVFHSGIAYDATKGGFYQAKSIDALMTRFLSAVKLDQGQSIHYTWVKRSRFVPYFQQAVDYWLDILKILDIIYNPTN